MRRGNPRRRSDAVMKNFLCSFHHRLETRNEPIKTSQSEKQSDFRWNFPSEQVFVLSQILNMFEGAKIETTEQLSVSVSESNLVVVKMVI